MKKIYFAIPVLSLLLASLLLPVFASAGAFTPYFGPIVSCSGSPQPGSALKQCTSFCDLLVTGQNIVKLAMTIGIYIIAPFFLIWGGVRIMVARGSAEEVKKAREMLLATVTGIAITVGAYIIVNTFFSVIGWTFPSIVGTNVLPGTQQSSWSEIRCK